VTERYALLYCQSGDAPGYLREALERISAVVERCRLSDLYRVTDRRPSAYCMVVAVVSREASSRLRNVFTRIAKAVNSLSTQPESGDALAIELFEHTGGVPEAKRSAGTARAFGMALAQVGAARLPAVSGKRTATASNNVARVPDTALLRREPVLDYDAPGGAASGYDEVRPLTTFDRVAFGTVRRVIRLHEGRRVLDVGCGTGRFTRLLAATGADVTGIDRSSRMLQAAQRGRTAGRNVRLERRDANRSFPPGQFDAMTFFFSIHYLTLSARFWARVHRTLAPRGRLAILTFPHRHFIETQLSEFFPGIARIDLARFPSVPHLIGLLRTNGFQHIRCDEVRGSESADAQQWIQRVERKYLSTFHLLRDEEFARGLHAMKRALKHRPVVRRSIEAVVVSARNP